MNNQILVADDDPDVLKLVATHLSGAGFHVATAGDGLTALSMAQKQGPAMLVLDVMMPGLSGLDVCRTLKRDQATDGIPIILLSARAEEVDKVVGFELGVEDYITKPFSPRELVLRVKAVFRRVVKTPESPVLLRVGTIIMDRERCTVTVDGRGIDPTPTEFKLLLTLMERAGRVVTREELLRRVWNMDGEVETRTVDTHLRRLRDRLGDASAQIQTVRGFGYRIS